MSKITEADLRSLQDTVFQKLMSDLSQDRYGSNKERRMLYCCICKARFSERKGTPLFRATLPDDKVLSILAHIDEDCGVRKTARLVGVNPNTVVRYSLLAGGHAKQLHDELVEFSPQYS